MRVCVCQRYQRQSINFSFLFCANKISVKNAIDFSNFFLCPCPSLSGHICFFRYFPVAFCCRGIDLPVYKQSHVFHEPTLIVDVSILSVSVSCQSQPTAKNILRCFLVSYLSISFKTKLKPLLEHTGQCRQSTTEANNRKLVLSFLSLFFWRTQLFGWEKPGARQR